MLFNSDEYNENGIKDAFFDLDEWIVSSMIDDYEEVE